MAMQGGTSFHRSTKVRPAFNTSKGDLQNIILHITQDMAEKVEEIEVKTEEEFRSERNREILINMKRIDSDYGFKENRAERLNIVYSGRMKNIRRLDVLNNKYFHILDTVTKARQRLCIKDQPAHAATYKEILRALIMQGLFKLMEPSVYVITRPEDREMVSDLLRQLKKDYEESIRLPVKIDLDNENQLPKDSEGGVILINTHGTVTLDNTLSSRLDHASFHLLPLITKLLFGEMKVSKETPTHQRRPSYLPTVEEVKHRLEIKLRQESINIEKLSIGKRVIYETAPPGDDTAEVDDANLGSLFSEQGE